jgi:hypothetical protein
MRGYLYARRKPLFWVENVLSENLDLRLKQLSTMQRRLIIETLQRHPQYWSKFNERFHHWKTRREILEEFMQTHMPEIVKAFAEAGLNSGFKAGGRRVRHVKG